MHIQDIGIEVMNRMALTQNINNLRTSVNKIFNSGYNIPNILLNNSLVTISVDNLLLGMIYLPKKGHRQLKNQKSYLLVIYVLKSPIIPIIFLPLVAFIISIALNRY